MQRPIAAVTAALLVICLPNLAGADDGMKYENLIHYAATNIVVASVLSLDDGETKNKTEIATYRNQAASLMVIATHGLTKDSKAVQADVSTEPTKLIGIMGDQTKSGSFIEQDVPTCNELGKAAVQAVHDVKAGK